MAQVEGISRVTEIRGETPKSKKPTAKVGYCQLKMNPMKSIACANQSGMASQTRPAESFDC